MRVITREQIEEPFLAPLGEIIYELVGSSRAAGGTARHSLAHAIVPPGKLSPRHFHKVSEETYYILAGRARMIIDGKEFFLSPGQTVLIMPNEVHQVFNDEQTDTLEFLVTCAPPWTADDFFET
jgi:mannose-6-phosphate isomerase-like protein (cupin superfamily)